jgi:5-methylcytosine-specific restriction endonuclease McrA
MNNIAQQAIVLKLNKHWQPLEAAVVQDVLIDLVSGVIHALDIGYKVKEDGSPDTTTCEYARPVKWEEWVTLPIRNWDPVIHSPRMTIRVPTVVITNNFDKMPTKKYKGKPTKEGLFFRDNGKDAYTNKMLDFDEATIDHVIPRDIGGLDTYDNAVLTTKEINNRKGNKLNKDAGLKLLIKPTLPKEIPLWKTIRKVRHYDWHFFLKI